MARGGKVKRVGHRLGGGVGGFVRPRLGGKNRRLGSVWVQADTCTLFEYPMGTPLETKLSRNSMVFVNLTHHEAVDTWY